MLQLMEEQKQFHMISSSQLLAFSRSHVRLKRETPVAGATGGRQLRRRLAFPSRFPGGRDVHSLLVTRFSHSHLSHASLTRILETRDEDSRGMLTSLPIELVRMILRRLSTAELFRVRRVCRSLRQEAEAAIARIETLVVNVVCSDAAAAAVAVTPSSCRLSNEALVLLPNSKCHRLLPSVKNLLVWPTFLSGGGDAKASAAAAAADDATPAAQVVCVTGPRDGDHGVTHSASSCGCGFQGET